MSKKKRGRPSEKFTVEIKEVEKMYQFINEYIGHLYYLKYRIKLTDEDASFTDIDYPHASTFVIEITTELKDRKELFLDVFHEYMHVVLVPLTSIANKDGRKYIGRDMEMNEECLIEALSQTLGTKLYNIYINNLNK